MKKRLTLFAVGLSLIGIVGQAAPKTKSAAIRKTPPAVQTHLDGYIGNRIDACIRVRVMSEDENLLVAPFKTQNESTLWQSEFWGKWMLGAIDAYRYNGDPELLQKITNAVNGILATQLEDGYIGNYKPEAQLDYWDVWGQKYTLLGLQSYFDLTGDKKALEGACRLADRLMTQIPAKKEIEAAGFYQGLPAISILEPFVYLYQHTQNEKYLDFARYIVSRMEAPEGPKLISKALNGVPVAERSRTSGNINDWYNRVNGQKAYEMMSCYNGLLELYKIMQKSGIPRRHREEHPKHHRRRDQHHRLGNRVRMFLSRQTSADRTHLPYDGDLRHDDLDASVQKHARSDEKPDVRRPDRTHHVQRPVRRAERRCSTDCQIQSVGRSPFCRGKDSAACT